MPKLKDIALGIVVAPLTIPIMLIASYQDKKVLQKELNERQNKKKNTLITYSNELKTNSNHRM